MKKYKATFTGREVNAIGIFYKIETITEGNTEDEARLKLYEKYEHIQELKLIEIE